MASTTKIMTCILALENRQEDQIVTASANAAGQPKVRLGVRDQEQFYLKDLLYSLMLESHNDSAVVIAEGIAGTTEEFAKLMNQKAQELGCNDTHFVTPNGLDASDEGGVHSTTARDLAVIMRYCITQSPCSEEFLEITRTKSYQFANMDGSRNFSCNNHNAFLDMMEGALSGKTGFTADAGYCYVGALKRDDRTFIVALLACGWPNNKGYKWTDTRKLMEYGIANYEYRNVWEDVELPEMEVDGGIEEKDPYECEIRIPLSVKGKEEIPVLLRADEACEVQTEVEESLTAPVRKGDAAGRVRYLLNGEEIAFMSFPTSDGKSQLCGGVWGFGIFDNGDQARIDASKQFIKYMCDSEKTADAVRTASFFAVRDTAEGTDLTHIWDDEPLMAEYTKLLPMLGEYYEDVPGWAQARTSWWNMLQKIGAGEDIASTVSTYMTEANTAAAG